MKCTCGYTIKYERPKNSYDIGEVMEKSGFFPVLGAQGRISWICPNCREKVGKLAQQIFDIIEREFVYISALLPKKEEDTE